jgi:two-component system, LytTR family, sensor kinase
MSIKSKSQFIITNLIILLAAIITGMILSVIISFVFRDFVWSFFEIALFNSTLLGLSMILSAYFTSYFIFRFKNSFIMLVSFFIVLWAGGLSFFLILMFKPVILLYYSNGIISYMAINLLFILSLNVITTGFKIYQETRQAQENAINEERYLKRETELKLLTSKLNPHFLFNSLNLVVSLLKRPEKAEKALIYLSDLLRYNLDFTEFDRVSLSQELENTKKYLELQKMRFANRIEYEINGDINAEIPPFLIQPLIENSIKYNINETDQLKIKIDLSKIDGRTIISIIDSCSKVNPEMLNKGTGLTATKKRVENTGGEFRIKDGGIEISFGSDKNNISR